MLCNNCDTNASCNLNKTAYGDYLCDDCWDDYICTDRGRVEYFIGLCNGDYPLSEFDADFICSVIESYKTYFGTFEYTPEQLTELESKAKAIGLL